MTTDEIARKHLMALHAVVMSLSAAHKEGRLPEWPEAHKKLLEASKMMDTYTLAHPRVERQTLIVDRSRCVCLRCGARYEEID